jgi:hypothetical protein
MADDAGLVMPADDGDHPPICPWCSATLPSADTAACPSCEARLVEPPDVVIPGVTAVDPALLALAAAPRKVKRTFGSLLIGDDNEIPPPSEAEMPALARPDADVRREILRLEMEAQLVALKAEVASRSADDAVAGGSAVDSLEAPEGEEPTEPPEGQEPLEAPEGEEPTEPTEPTVAEVPPDRA